MKWSAIERRGDRVDSVLLASGETVSVGTIVNATGPRAALTARMAGLELPVEPRLRYTFMFDAAEQLVTGSAVDHRSQRSACSQ